MQMVFRAAALSDIPELCRLRLAYFEEDFGKLPEPQIAAISAQLPQYFSAHLGRDCAVFAAEAPDGTLAANAILLCSEKPANPYFPNGKSGYVLGVYTMPEYRGQGIATRLMQMLQEYAAAVPLDIVTLSASEMGMGVYEKIGFTVRHTGFTEMEWIPE